VTGETNFFTDTGENPKIRNSLNISLMKTDDFDSKEGHEIVPLEEEENQQYMSPVLLQDE